MKTNSESSPSSALSPAELLAEIINDGFLLVDPKWEIIYSNRKAQQLLRRSATELAGCELWQVIPVESNASAQQTLERALQQQATVEVDVFYPNLFTWHEVRAAPSPQGLILILRDVTDRQWLIHHEAERTYLRNVFMNAPVAMSVLRTAHHQFEFINVQGQRLIGGRNVEGLTVREAFPELVEQGFLDILDHVYQTGESYQVTESPVQIDRNGTGVLEESLYNISFQALKGFDGKVSGILSISIEA